jgi:RNA polymerase sigma factor (TIGR02999 family)
MSGNVAVSADAKGSPALLELFGTLYSDLHRLAARELRRNTALTLSTTTLLHETFVSLSPQRSLAFGGKDGFLAYAARAMRSLVIDHVRHRRAQKRGSGYEISSLRTDPPYVAEADVTIEKLSEALDVLAVSEPRLAECVDLKFFCGFSFGEIAQMWQVSERTVRRDWNRARLLLHGMVNDMQLTRTV